MAHKISIQNLTVSYERHPAVHHVSCEFHDGLTAILGPNGGGKSTLLKAIMGLVPIETGTIKHEHCSRRDFAYLAQLPQQERDFPITVLEVVLSGHIFKMGPFAGLFRRMTPAHMQKAHDALTLVDLTGFDDRPISTLSAGQFQRMMFARTIVQDAHVILLDEPFAGVDMRSTTTLLRLMQQWQSENRIVLCVLHDTNMAAQYFPNAILIARELIAAGSTQDVLQSDYLNQARNLAEAWDDNAALCRPESQKLFA